MAQINCACSDPGYFRVRPQEINTDRQSGHIHRSPPLRLARIALYRDASAIRRGGRRVITRAFNEPTNGALAKCPIVVENKKPPLPACSSALGPAANICYLLSLIVIARTTVRVVRTVTAIKLPHYIIAAGSVGRSVGGLRRLFSVDKNF